MPDRAETSRLDRERARTLPGDAATDAGDFVARFAEAWREQPPHPAEAIPQAIEGLMRAIPDVPLRVLRWASRGEDLFERELTGTVGDERLVVPGINRFTLRGRRAVEGVAYFDTGALER